MARKDGESQNIEHTDEHVAANPAADGIYQSTLLSYGECRMSRTIRLLSIVFVLPLALALAVACSGPSAATVPASGSTQANAPASSAGQPTQAAAPAKKAVVMGLSISNLSFPWQKLLTDASVAAIKAGGGQSIVLDSQGKVDKQNSDIEDLITKKVDIILLNANDGKAVVPAVLEANKANIPVIATSRRVEGGTVAQFISNDNVKAGLLAAQRLEAKIQGKAEVALIEGTPGNSSASDRTQGFTQEVKNHPDFTLVYDRPGNFDRATALNLTEDLLQAHPNVKGIFYENDDMAIGGLQAIQSAGKLGKIEVVSNDGIQDGLQAIKDGKLDATIFNDAVSIGKISVDSAFKIVAGQKVESYVSPPMPVIDKSTVDKYLTTK